MSIWIKVIREFLSSRNNLTIFQCLMYGVVGYITYTRQFSWVEMCILFVVLFGIQFVTRLKAVADGMLFRQLMMDLNVDANEIARRIKKEADRTNKDDWN